MVINLNKKTEELSLSNVTVRGVEKTAFEIRPHIKIIEGVNFNSGSREVIVGKSIRDRFYNCEIGDRVKFANDFWTIVGVMSADGGAFESEIWGDAKQLQAAFNRQNSVSTMTLRLADHAQLEDLKKTFEQDRRLVQFEPKTEIKFYREQSESLATFISALGTAITIIFSFGAIISAVITMYTAVANRTIEIGTLRALGFRRRSVLASFLTETIIIAAVGGALGIFMASFLQFFSISTLNFNSFAELAFSFSLSPDIVISSMKFAIIMGIIGGFFPAVRAARLKIVDSLRSA